MTNMYLAVKEEIHSVHFVALYKYVLTTFHHVFLYFLIYFSVIFQVSMYNILKRFSVKKAPKLLVLQSISYGVTLTKENGIAYFCLLNHIMLLQFERLYKKKLSL